METLQTQQALLVAKRKVFLQAILEQKRNSVVYKEVGGVFVIDYSMGDGQSVYWWVR